MKPSRQVFGALRNGTLSKEIYESSTDQLRPYMSTLMLCTFSKNLTKPKISEEICSKIVDHQLGNQLMLLMKCDYSEIERKCSETTVFKETIKNFHQLTLEEKLLQVCMQLISQVRRYQNPATTLSNFIENYDPFDIEHYHEEVTWMVTMASFHIPKLFDLRQIAITMLSYMNGPKLISYFTANQPVEFDRILKAILAIKCPDEDGFLTKQRNLTIAYLLEMDHPSTTQRILIELLDSGANLNIIVHILCSEIIEDESFVRLMISYLNKKDGKLAGFLTKSGNRTNLKKLCERIDKAIGQPSLTKDVIILIAMFCSLFTIRLTANESLKWIAFLTSQKKLDEYFMKITLCAILSCPQLFNYVNGSKEHSLIAEQYVHEYLKWLKEMVNKEPTSLKSLSQLMLLIAAHFNSNKTEELAYLFANVLGFQVTQVQTTARKSSLLKSLYMNHITEDRDPNENEKIDITKKLNAKSLGPFPAHTISQLLSNRHNFTSPNIKIIENWIKLQLIECEAPIHPIMAELLEKYAKCCVPENENLPYLEKIDEDYFLNLFTWDIFDHTKLVPRVLALFYILTYSHILDTQPLPTSFQLGLNHSRTRSTMHRDIRYSGVLWSRIPIRYILSLMDSQSENFQPVRAIKMRLVVFFMPHMLPTIDEGLGGLPENEMRNSSLDSRRSITEAQLGSALKALPNNLERFSQMIEIVDASPIREQYRHFHAIAEAMFRTLNAAVPQEVSQIVCAIWHRLENIVPRHIYEATFRHWSTDKAMFSDNELLVSKPMMLFRVDEQIFTSPPHFQCLANMLAFYLEANRTWYSTQLKRALSDSQTIDGDPNERNDLYAAFDGAQHSSIVQMLLEICAGDPVKQPYLEEIRRIACAQIHEMFIANISLAKLVHFQTYPLHLIPIMIKGVPSTHVVLTYMSELLATPNIKRRIFAIALMAELIDRYKIVDSFQNVELIGKVLETLLDNSPSEQNLELFLKAVSVMERFVQISPFSAESYIEILERVRQLALSRLAVSPSLYASRYSLEKRLQDLIERTLEQC